MDSAPGGAMLPGPDGGPAMTEPRKNHFKAALADMRPVHGVWCQIGDSAVAEMIAAAGFDWMLFDTEHSPLTAASILPLLQAVAAYPVSALVRPASLDVVDIKKILDLGAQTLLIPMVQTAEQAALAVAAVTYPPAGIRGVAGATRASGFGRIAGYHARARDEICLLVQVETVEAVAQIEAIAAVPGIDGIFVGPADLAASMGFPGEPGRPEVRAAVVEAIRRIRAADQPPGILTPDPVLFDAACAAGAVFVARDIDLLALRKGLSRG